jgi:transmembrane sensor
VVTAGDREITALGTAFLVRREAQRIAVTLVEGKVAVMQVGGGGSPAIGPVDGAAAASAITLSPGDRATFSSGTPTPRLDRPMIGRLTAWQQGRVQVDNLTLADAITEMNRYSALQLAVEGQDASRIRLSGTFKVGDSRAFAGAVAQTHGLEIREERHRIVLFGVPHEPDAAHFEPASPRPAVP